MLTPIKVLRLSVFAALATMALKIGAWAVTDSVAYLSDAVESLVNLLAAGFAILMVSWAQQPADEGHPFGHGKAEYFSAAFEGGMIVCAALAILLTAAERFLNPVELGALELGTVLSILASAVNLVVARLLFTVGKANGSPALLADSKHLLTDVWTTAGVVLGLGLAWLTGMSWLDPLLAVLVAMNILYAGFRLLTHAMSALMDAALPGQQRAGLESALNRLLYEEGRYGECRLLNLRTRSAGQESHAELELLVPGDWTVRQGHALADQLALVASKMGVRLVVHVEPL
ncbi:MAG: cation diffusion facilitator family transporter [Pseudomonadales bacterium]|nr:cation diffusion facilitator family transporter [Pseudomonadales bacterium]